MKALGGSCWAPSHARSRKRSLCIHAYMHMLHAHTNTHIHTHTYTHACRRSSRSHFAVVKEEWRREGEGGGEKGGEERRVELQRRQRKWERTRTGSRGGWKREGKGR